MTYNVVLTEPALEDIQKSAMYISDTLMNSEAAQNLINSISEKFEVLSEMPYINPIVRDSVLASYGLRFQRINNYLALYVIHEDKKTVSIIRFQHSSRDWISLLKLELK